MAITQTTLSPVTGAVQFVQTVSANAADTVKGSGATIYTLQVDNTVGGAAAAYVKLYHTAGAVVVGTTAPDQIFLAPAAVVSTWVMAGGIAAATGLQIATVTTGGTAGTTSPAQNTIVRCVYV